MKKGIIILFAILTLAIATPVMAASVKVETQNSFVAPARGTKFNGPQTVTIKIKAGDLVPGYDTFCEVVAYSDARNGLKVLEQEFPVTSKGQTITTTLYASDIGKNTIYKSTLFYVNGFINYAEEQNMYIYNTKPVFAGNATSFEIVEKSASNSGKAIKDATITVSKKTIKYRKKATVKVTSDSNAKLKVKAANAKAKKYVKIKNGKVAKLVFSKKAPKAKYKFIVTSPAKGKFKKTTKKIVIKVK